MSEGRQNYHFSVHINDIRIRTDMSIFSYVNTLRDSSPKTLMGGYTNWLNHDNVFTHFSINILLICGVCRSEHYRARGAGQTGTERDLRQVQNVFLVFVSFFSRSISVGSFRYLLFCSQMAARAHIRLRHNQSELSVSKYQRKNCLRL